MDTTRDYGLIRQPHPITRVAVANAAPATISATSRAAAAIELSWMPAWPEAGGVAEVAEGSIWVSVRCG